MEARMYIGTDKGVVTLQSRDGHAWETEAQGLQSWGVPSVAYVPGEANLWPGLTGAETLHLLGRVHGAVDVSYRDLRVERFQLDPSKKVRAYSKGNRQKLLLIAGLMCRPDLLVLDTSVFHHMRPVPGAAGISAFGSVPSASAANRAANGCHTSSTSGSASATA